MNKNRLKKLAGINEIKMSSKPKILSLLLNNLDADVFVRTIVDSVNRGKDVWEEIQENSGAGKEEFSESDQNIIDSYVSLFKPNEVEYIDINSHSGVLPQGCRYYKTMEDEDDEFFIILHNIDGVK